MSTLPWLLRKSKSTILDASTNSIRTGITATTDTPPFNTSTKSAGTTDSTSLSTRDLFRRLRSRFRRVSEPHSGPPSAHHLRRSKRAREASSLRRIQKHTGHKAGKEESDTVELRTVGPGPDESASIVKYSQPRYRPQAKTCAPDDLRSSKTGTCISIPQTAYSVPHRRGPSTLQPSYLPIRDQQQQRANNIH